MLRKVIKFEDFEGNEVEQAFYFNLTKAEILEMELGSKEGLSNYLQAIVDAGDNKAIVEIFKKIILAAVGRKSEDGHRFIKDDEAVNALIQTNAYSELFLELAGDADAAVDFITNVMPKNLESNGHKTPNLQRSEQEKKAQLRAELEAQLKELGADTRQSLR
jgi:hypothetical protein|nr:MAG TPA: hypothetical protein [Caudoviricetes sp.]